MKEIYEEPKIKIIKVEAVDVIAISGGSDTSKRDNIGEWDF